MNTNIVNLFKVVQANKLFFVKCFVCVCEVLRCHSVLLANNLINALDISAKSLCSFEVIVEISFVKSL